MWVFDLVSCLSIPGFSIRNKDHMCRNIKYSNWKNNCLKSHFEMPIRGSVCANKSIKKYESLLWWSIHLSIVSVSNLVNTRVRYGFSKLEKKNVCLLKINEICPSVKTSYRRLFSNAHQMFFLSQQINPKAWGCSLVIWLSIHGLTSLL